ncbi:hypothetical protein PENSPDRAFT_544361, partial [Peniophora sp. CONT]
LLRQSELEGFKGPDDMAKLIATLFADDTTVYLRYGDDFEVLTALLNRWCKASRARFNISKTEIIPVGSRAYRDSVYATRKLHENHLPISADLKIIGENTATRSLGSRIGNHIDEEAVWALILEKLDGRTKFWYDNNRFPELHVRKTFSKWLHDGMTQFMEDAQHIPDSVCDELQKRVIDFIWAGKKGHMVNQETLELHRDKGGLGITNQKARRDAIALKRWKRF